MPIERVSNQKAIRCGIYCRISRDDEGDMLGVRRQERDSQDTAARKGWPVVEVYVDDDVSAWSGKPRPAYRQMLADIKAGRINAVVVYDLDRLHRLPKELEQFFEICDTAGALHLATVSGDVNLASSDGQFHARMMGAVAKKSSDDTSRRLKRVYDQIAEAGMPHGPRAFGYMADRMTLDPKEAPVVQEMVKRVLAGEGLNSIARDINERGIKGPQGGRAWAGTTVRSVVSNPRIAALRTHRGTVIGKAAWQPIIDTATHERIVAHFADPTRRMLTPPRRRLLTGLVFCGRCGGPLVYGGPKRKALRCAKAPGRVNCGGISASIAPVERCVTDFFFTYLAGRFEIAATPDTDDAQAIDDVAQLDERMRELSMMFAAGEINRVEWVTARRGIEEKLSAARRQVSEASRASAAASFIHDDPHTIEARWSDPDTSVDQKRLVLARYVDRVTIEPTLRRGCDFDDNRINITWLR